MPIFSEIPVGTVFQFMTSRGTPSFNFACVKVNERDYRVLVPSSVNHTALFPETSKVKTDAIVLNQAKDTHD